ncbi:MAG: hypothetical protein JXR49_01035 [Acidobacteria bacterium]|nr:hypothetical protein [Acidobacteriota bacterium]
MNTSLYRNIFLLFCIPTLLSVPGYCYSPEKADFSISIKNLQIPYREFAVFAVPGENLVLDVMDNESAHEYSIETALLAFLKKKRSWEVTVPLKKGRYSIAVHRIGTDQRILLNIFSTVPSSGIRDGHLNGYRIGKYPAVLTGKPFVTKPPAHYIEVTRENKDVAISPHFKLKQFLCKQQGSFPKYLVLDEVLILKLEMILEEVNSCGYPADTFHIMSGYRTPYYNKAIGNVAYSRHLWGKAADIFIDRDPLDDRMDDLNKDGTVNKKDAKILFDIVESLTEKKWYQKFLGGLGQYGSNPSHGPFVHIDSRGYRARW